MTIDDALSAKESSDVQIFISFPKRDEFLLRVVCAQPNASSTGLAARRADVSELAS